MTLLRARLARQWRLLALSALAAALAAALEVAPAWLVAWLAAALLHPAGGYPPPAWLAAGILAATCLRNVLLGMALMASHAAAFRLIQHLRQEMAEKIARLPLPALSSREGELKKTVLDDAGRIENLLAHNLPDLVAALVAPLLAGALLLVADWRMLLAALAPLPVAVLAQARLRRHFARNAAEWHAAETTANGAMLSYLRGLPTLKAFGRDASSLEGLRNAIQSLARLAAETTRHAAPAYAVVLTSLSANIAVLLPLALLLGAGVPELLLFVLLGTTLAAPLLRLLPALAAWEKQRQGVRRIAALLAEPEQPPHRRPGRAPERFDIGFEGVRFAHAPGREVLRGIDLACAEGRVTGLVGPSGAGKSTLLGLVPRFQDATAGVVRIGGVDVRDIPPERLRTVTACVFQETRLFSGTVAENLRLAAPAAGDAALRKVLEEVALAAALPLERVLGENGAPLSGGQRQRLAIARALLKDAPVLLLDEATASLDAMSELAVQRALARLTAGRTVLVVAHRLSTVMGANRIAVLREGVVEATGSHDALLRRAPTYAALWAAQARTAGWCLRPDGPLRADIA